MSFHLLAAVLDRKGYIVGDANANSGLHILPNVSTIGGDRSIEALEALWRHVGWDNVRCFGFDVGKDEAGATLFIAGGNGVLRSKDLSQWRITTDWRMTEVLDVIVSRNVNADGHPGIVAATAYGPFRSDDWGGTWSEYGHGLNPDHTSETYCQVVEFDGREASMLMGTEAGLFRRDVLSESAGWVPVGERDVPIRSIASSPGKEKSGDRWFVGTDGYGLMIGTGQDSWSTRLANKVIYTSAVSPHNSQVIAAGGYDPTLWVSRDGGDRFDALEAPNANISLHAAAFDPMDQSKIWLGTTDSGIYCVDIGTGVWKFVGLADASIRKLSFIPADVLHVFI